MSIMTQPPVSAPPAPPAAELPTGNTDRQRLLLMVGGGAALLVVAALAYFFLFSGSGTSKIAAPPVKVVVAGPTGSAKASTAPVAPLKTFGGLTPKNPFKALIASSTTTGTASTATSGTAAATGAAATTGSSASTGSAAGTTAGTTASTSSVPLQVTLKSTNGTSSASVWVYNTSTKKTAKYTPKIGDTFGTYFKLTGFVTSTSTGAKGALVEYGDTILTMVVGNVDTVQ